VRHRYLTGRGGCILYTSDVYMYTQSLCMYISHTQSVCPTGRGWCLQVTQCIQCVSHREGSRSAGGDQETAGCIDLASETGDSCCCEGPPCEDTHGVCVCVAYLAGRGVRIRTPLPVRLHAGCVWPTHRCTCCALILYAVLVYLFQRSFSSKMSTTVVA